MLANNTIHNVMSVDNFYSVSVDGIDYEVCCSFSNADEIVRVYNTNAARTCVGTATINNGDVPSVQLSLNKGSEIVLKSYPYDEYVSVHDLARHIVQQ